MTELVDLSSKQIVVEDDRLVLPDDMDLWEIAVAVVRGKLTLSRDQMRVLIEMFPYLRPKLSAVGHFDGKSFAEQLAAEERAIERSKQPVPMLNAPKTIEHEELVSSSDLKKPFQRNYRRFTSTR
jgi:hypothetical protein